MPKSAKNRTLHKKGINRERALGGGWGGGGPNPPIPPNVVLHTTTYTTQNQDLPSRTVPL